MPDPKKHDPDTQPSNPPSEPYRKPQPKPVGRDNDATPGRGGQPDRTPNRTGPQSQGKPGETRPGSGTPVGGEVDDGGDIQASGGAAGRGPGTEGDL